MGSLISDVNIRNIAIFVQYFITLSHRPYIYIYIYMHLSHHSTQNNKNISNEHVNTSKAFALYVSTMCTSGSANVQYGHVTDNKLSRQSLRKNRETIREFPCCNKHEIIIRFSGIVGKNAFFWDRVNASCLCFGTCMFCWPRCMKTYTVSSTTLDRCRPDV